MRIGVRGAQSYVSLSLNARENGASGSFNTDFMSEGWNTSPETNGTTAKSSVVVIPERWSFTPISSYGGMSSSSRRSAIPYICHAAVTLRIAPIDLGLNETGSVRFDLTLPYRSYGPDI